MKTFLAAAIAGFSFLSSTCASDFTAIPLLGSQSAFCYAMLLPADVLLASRTPILKRSEPAEGGRMPLRAQQLEEQSTAPLASTFKLATSLGTQPPTPTFRHLRNQITFASRDRTIRNKVCMNNLMGGTIYDFQKRNDLRFEICGDFKSATSDTKYEQPFSVFFVFSCKL